MGDLYPDSILLAVKQPGQYQAQDDSNPTRCQRGFEQGLVCTFQVALLCGMKIRPGGYTRQSTGTSCTSMECIHRTALA